MHVPLMHVSPDVHDMPSSQLPVRFDHAVALPLGFLHSWHWLAGFCVPVS